MKMDDQNKKGEEMVKIESITQTLKRQIKFKKRDLHKAEEKITEFTHATAMAIITVVAKKAELKALEEELAKMPTLQPEDKK